MKIENPLHIHCKKDHHVGHKLELIIFRHCEYEIFKEKIALNSTQLKLIHTHENNSSSLVDNIRNDTSIWKDDMSKQFEMTKDIVMPITNT